MSEGVSPLTFQIMLACYVSGDPEGVVGARTWNTQVAAEARDWLLDSGLIDRNDFPRATAKGEAWVNRALATPMPKQVWVFDE